MARTQVTGQAIRPKRRAKGGAGSSITAPSTPVRGVLGRSRSVEQGRDQGHAQAKSMEVNTDIESKIINNSAGFRTCRMAMAITEELEE